jgi:hypothetical protein
MKCMKSLLHVAAAELPAVLGEGSIQPRLPLFRDGYRQLVSNYTDRCASEPITTKRFEVGTREWSTGATQAN